jgi:flavin-dependent dehydrogenase
MVHGDGGVVSLSCCIRRDRLAQIRSGGDTAGAAVQRHLMACCRGVEQALAGATAVESWLAAGPIRPGLRRTLQPGIFLVGNARGEAHPIIAEGISIALLSGGLLAEVLAEGRERLDDDAWLLAAERRYRRAWLRQFALRIRASSAFARLAMQPAVSTALLALFRLAPGLIGHGARLAGKAALAD